MLLRTPVTDSYSKLYATTYWQELLWLSLCCSLTIYPLRAFFPLSFWSAYALTSLFAYLCNTLAGLVLRLQHYLLAFLRLVQLTGKLIVALRPTETL